MSDRSRVESGEDVEPTSFGDSIALVVRLQETADGRWCVDVDGTSTLEAIPLLPVTFVIQLWRSSSTGVLRGTIQLYGSDHTAAIQGNTQLIDIIRDWLLVDGASHEVS